jgi:molybdopterin converting factor small subunit
MDIGQDAIILVNGRNITDLHGKNTPLAETDTVSIFPLVAGG